MPRCSQGICRGAAAFDCSYRGKIGRGGISVRPHDVLRENLLHPQRLTPLGARLALQVSQGTRVWVHQPLESIMGILLFLVFGLIVGFIARAIMPGAQKMTLLATMVLGVVGSFIGGFVGALLTSSRVLDFNT